MVGVTRPACQNLTCCTPKVANCTGRSLPPGAARRPQTPPPLKAEHTASGAPSRLPTRKKPSRAEGHSAIVRSRSAPMVTSTSPPCTKPRASTSAVWKAKVAQTWKVSESQSRTSAYLQPARRTWPEAPKACSSEWARQVTASLWPCTERCCPRSSSSSTTSLPAAKAQRRSERNTTGGLAAAWKPCTRVSSGHLANCTSASASLCKGSTAKDGGKTGKRTGPKAPSERAA
mmetsp:Transcript_95264/g.171980  ORF Transcript_95264/g.171980 Transcript_95264/m.171980 type:complete len:231 (-) Transcript_95264:54-746(-)